MVYGLSLPVHRLVRGEDYRQVFKILAEFDQQALIGPVRKGAIRFPVFPVHHHASGGLQEDVISLG